MLFLQNTKCMLGPNKNKPFSERMDKWTKEEFYLIYMKETPIFWCKNDRFDWEAKDS